MSVLVKICGLNGESAVDVALAAGADMLGFVFFPASPRHVGLDAARKLGSRVRGRARTVALTVDADATLLDDIVEALRPDLLQFHGTEPPERVAAARQRYGVAAVKAVAVAARHDLAAAAAYCGIADYLLFDARAPKKATRPGGLGQSFDWRLLEDFDAGAPFLLSGGLDAGNVGAALRITRATGVDVSSGVERLPGVKDPDKIRAFVDAVRAAARDVGRPASPAPATAILNDAAGTPGSSPFAPRRRRAQRGDGSNP